MATMTQVPVILGAAFLALVLTFGLAAWLIEMEEPKGRHHRPRPVRVMPDYGQQVIKPVRTMNSPPPELFGFTPDWSDEVETWKFDTLSMLALRMMLYEHRAV